MKRKEIGSLSSPLGGWSREEQFGPAAAGRRIFADPIFTDGLGSAPARKIRPDSDIMTRDLTSGGAKRVSSEEFWALNEAGESVAVLKGRDIAVWASP